MKVGSGLIVGIGLKCGVYGGILGGVAGGNLYILTSLPLHILVDGWEMPNASPLIALIGCSVLLVLATITGGFLGFLGGAISGLIAALVFLIHSPPTKAWGWFGAIMGGLIGVLIMVSVLRLNTPLVGIGEIDDFMHMVFCGLIGGCIGGIVGGRRFGKLLSQVLQPQRPSG